MNFFRSNALLNRVLYSFDEIFSKVNLIRFCSFVFFVSRVFRKSKALDIFEIKRILRNYNENLLRSAKATNNDYTKKITAAVTSMSKNNTSTTKEKTNKNTC